MNAKEMFEKLGYKCHESKNGIQYFSESGVEITFIFMIRRFYKQENFKSLNISADEFKAIQQQMKELGWIEPEQKQETNFEHYYNDLLKIGWNSGFGVTNGKIKHCNNVDCGKCYIGRLTKKVDCATNAIKWLASPYKKPVYKLTKFEHDLLQSYSDIYSFNAFNSLSGMKEKGYFKGIDDNKTIGEILAKCEVVG